jgi:hypothetical protein
MNHVAIINKGVTHERNWLPDMTVRTLNPNPAFFNMLMIGTVYLLEAKFLVLLHFLG